MNKLLAAFAAGALVTMTIAAFAGEKMEQMMDANGDGKISKAEFMQGHEKMFNAMDKNKDGVLETSERQTMMRKGMMMHERSKGMMMQ